MRKTIFLFVILCMVLIFTSCYSPNDSTHKDDIPADNEKPSKLPPYDSEINTMLPSFDSVEEFKNVYADIPNSVFHKAYIDFDSIISNNEVIKITAGLDFAGGEVDENVTRYTVTYKSENEEERGLYIIIGYGKKIFYDYFFTLEKDDILSDGKEYNALKDVPEGNSESFVCNIDGICMLYSYYNGKCTSIRFVIDEHYFDIYSSWSASLAQDKFISAFLPELGATDDSVIAMLDKIKALIPKS